MTDREPTITDIKERIADLNDQITNYEAAFKALKLVKEESNLVTVIGNNGSVSCNKYCHGTSGQSWNNELPSAWQGAQCVAAGKNRNIPCTQAIRDPSDPMGYLQCVCKRNDSFPYETRPNAENFPDVTDSTIVSTQHDYDDIKHMGDSISDQITAIRELIKSVNPKMEDKYSKINEAIFPLLNKIQKLQDTYEELVEKAEIPNYYDDDIEVANTQARSNFNKYGWCLLFFILFFIAFIFVLKKPEVGNLDRFMLALGVGILLYYAYNYYDMKQRAQGKPSLSWFRPKWTKKMLAKTRWR